MLPSRRWRTLASAATLAALAACSSNPEFRTNIANQTYDALGELYVLLARADLGTLRAPSSYAGAADSYAAVLGGFQIGGLLAKPSPADRRGTPPDHLKAALAQCVDQLRRMADQHRTAGLPPDAPVLRAVRTSCVAAATSVAADETSSWVLTTVAGDL